MRSFPNPPYASASDGIGAWRLATLAASAPYASRICFCTDGVIGDRSGNDNGRLRLLVNNIGNRNHWLGMRIVGKQGRDMLGARVVVTLRDGTKRWRRVRSDGSYASASDPRVLVGLGTSAERPTVQVHWPDGHVEQWADVAVDRWTTLKEGSGK